MVDDAIDEYALGIADPSQQVAIERHLSRCKRCSELVASYRQTVAALALAVPLASPPVSARTAMLSRIAVTPQGVALPESVFSGNLDTFRTPTLPSANAIAAPMPAQPVNPSPWWRVYAAPLATLPLLLALGLVSAWGFNNYAKLNDAKGELALHDQPAVPASIQPDLDEQVMMQLVLSPSSKRYNMSADLTSENANSSGIMFADPITGQAALQVEGLPAGSYAVLVQTQDGSMEQKAVFEVGNDGIATTAVDLGDQVSDFQSIHIRESNGAITGTDVAVEEPELQDVLMGIIPPDINQGSGTGLQGP
jgi:hypothetical protein